MGKQYRQSFPTKSKWHLQSPLELVHTDHYGPMQVLSLEGSGYFLLFVDDCTRKTWVCRFKEKSEALSYFNVFEFQVEKSFGFQIKNLRSNRGEEFMSSLFDDFFDDHGIRHELAALYSCCRA